ncbi:MFS transporter [Labrys sp. KNU-23]|uniref:MFS transporter n=1 Tax=Labrys sp. KNU-23 TaxID=2789216 RepID=UPI0011EEFC71|nr:MFS transporter [Labrys sp. KNU-23]QEN86709.1 MFS transporter [Labrys sp. KNU-23]
MSTPDETRSTSRGWQFFILACTLLVIGFGSGAASISLSAIFQEFALSYAIIGTVTSGVVLFLIVFLALGGRLRALVGDKALLLAATSVFVIGEALVGLAPDFSVWAIGRLLQGAATGCLLSVSLALAADNARRQWRGDVMSVLLALYFLGTAFGPGMAGYITAFYSWRDVAYASAALGVIVLILQAVFVTAPRRPEIETIFD